MIPEIIIIAACLMAAKIFDGREGSIIINSELI
jgi:hypothetical protein